MGPCARGRSAFHLSTLVALGALLACVQGEAKGEKTVNDETSWKRSGDLEIQLELPAGPHRPGAELTARLHFRNAGKEPVRIYLVMGEPFRYGQSTLDVRSSQPGGRPNFQPRPRPHGYVVTEKDFHLLSPGEERVFDQALRIPKGIAAADGELEVRWTYENKVAQWKGGVQTLDGPTKALFDGKPIPHIFLGEVETRARIRIATE